MRLENAFNAGRTESLKKDMLFKVNPMGIDRKIFLNPRVDDEQQEKTRSIIMEAFAVVDSNPEKYSMPFYIFTSEKSWSGVKTVAELKSYAQEMQGNMADWVDLGLMWAQKISNGATWKSICNDDDTSPWYRMITWKNGFCRIFGGACNRRYYKPESEVYNHDFKDESNIDYTVPLIAIREP